MWPILAFDLGCAALYPRHMAQGPRCSGLAGTTMGAISRPLTIASRSHLSSLRATCQPRDAGSTSDAFD
jgi:hypothetical protein